MTDRDTGPVSSTDEDEQIEILNETTSDNGIVNGIDEPAPESDDRDRNDLAGDAVPVDPNQPDELRWANSTGAFVLGALNPDDMRQAAAEYARSPATCVELGALLPVADILVRLYQSQPAAPPTEPGASVERARVIVPRSASRVAADDSLRPASRAETSASRSLASFSIRGLPLTNLLMAALAVLAAIAVLWALALTDRIGTRDDEISALNRQVAELRAANASAYALYPTADGGTAQGTVFYSPANSSVLLDITGLPALEEGRVYQVWFQRTQDAAWETGPIFVVNSAGESVQRLPGEGPTFSQIAISNEPEPGSNEPTGPFLVTGALAAADG